MGTIMTSKQQLPLPFLPQSCFLPNNPLHIIGK